MIVRYNESTGDFMEFDLIRLKNKLDTSKMKKPSFLMVVIATGNFAYKRNDDVYIVPIGSLKN